MTEPPKDKKRHLNGSFNSILIDGARGTTTTTGLCTTDMTGATSNVDKSLLLSERNGRHMVNKAGCLLSNHNMKAMRKHKRTSYIPETNGNDSSIDGSSKDGEEHEDSETSPLLDISKEIEQCSEDWPIDPDGNSVTLTDDVSHFNGFKLAHPFGRPKRFMLEVFIMVNMAQLMYTAMLVFTKSAMLAHGASITNLFLYRCAVLFFI